MKLLRLHNVSIFEQLQIEEALFRVGRGEWCLLNSGSPAAIVMGISGNAEALVEPSPLPLIRRFTGGGCVVVDESTLFVTFIGDMPHPTPTKIHSWVEARIKPLLDPLPFSLRENDYVLGDKKFGGSAQSIAKNRFLHHTSLLWSFNPELMAFLKMPPKSPSYRRGRSHAEFLTSLSPYFPSKALLFDRLTPSLAPFEIPASHEIEALLSLPHRRSLVLCKINFPALG